MDYVDILAKFLEMFPQFHEQICQYAPNGSYCITVWFKNGQTFDFEYISDILWTFKVHERRRYRYTSEKYHGRYAR